MEEQTGMDQRDMLAFVGDLYLSDRAKALEITRLQARVAELETGLAESGSNTAPIPAGDGEPR